MSAPQLEGDALAAVRHRDSHLQIIASAGSGKTEIVAQRVADLLAEGVSPRSIVAFTFTERAATELRLRVAERAEQRIGQSVLGQLAGLFVGTIHGYCFRLLQTHVPRYETFDVLDDHQLTAFLAREATRLDLRKLHPKNHLFQSIALFLKSISVIENELIDPNNMPEPFRSVLRDYLDTLDRYRLLTYGQQIVRAVRELEVGSTLDLVTQDLRHLIVDEYQDVNPAQERLIELLSGSKVELCVVGDDDQAIYQWRGSDIRNIVRFRDRYPSVATYSISINRRSRPGIINVANDFARTISKRLDKIMIAHRPPSGAREIVVWHAENEAQEAERIAHLILEMKKVGLPYRDIAVLVRSATTYKRLVDTFSALDIPVQPEGRTGMFAQPEALVLGRTFAWLSDIDWRPIRGAGSAVALDNLLDDYERVFSLDMKARERLCNKLEQWKTDAFLPDRTADLVGELYVLLGELNIGIWNLESNLAVNRLGTLARFSALLADYESVRRRARPDVETPGEQVGGQNRGDWYYKNLAIHIVNYAQGAYEGFDGEANFELDAVDLTTVHRAKGLEWPVVFIPSVTASRFPARKTGNHQDWLVPREAFAATRYEGNDDDERRLFYVGLTRARDWVSVSRHDRVTTQRTKPSPYYQHLKDHEIIPETVDLPNFESKRESLPSIEITFSELAAFLECAHAYRLRNLIGFRPRLAPELGYGRAVHHVLRSVANFTKINGVVPREATIDEILSRDFFLPSANKVAHRQLKKAARRLIVEYTTRHSDDLFRVWETERPFELRLNGITVTGRADVILDKEGGIPSALALLDYKTSTQVKADADLQLQVYSDAGRKEGLAVRGAYIHDLGTGTRSSVDVGDVAISNAEQRVLGVSEHLRAHDYSPSPGHRCTTCEVRTICGHAYKLG